MTFTAFSFVNGCNHFNMPNSFLQMYPSDFDVNVRFKYIDGVKISVVEMKDVDHWFKSMNVSKK